MNNNNIWVVIPSYNEEKNISRVIRDVKKYAKNIVIVDDGSFDNTTKIAKKYRVNVIRHIVNLGKGAALKSGCIFAISKGAEIIITMDGDGQHKGEDIPRFIKALQDYDIVFGYRRLNKEMPMIYRIGNWFISWIIKILYGIRLFDTQCGYRAFKSKIYTLIEWEAEDYSVESELIAKVGKNNISYTQIPIDTIYKDKYKGTTVIDGIKIVVNMIWWKITR